MLIVFCLLLAPTDMNTVEFTEYRKCQRENSKQVGKTRNMQSTEYFPKIKSW